MLIVVLILSLYFIFPASSHSKINQTLPDRFYNRQIIIIAPIICLIPIYSSFAAARSSEIDIFADAAPNILNRSHHINIA